MLEYILKKTLSWLFLCLLWQQHQLESQEPGTTGGRGQLEKTNIDIVNLLNELLLMPLNSTTEQLHIYYDHTEFLVEDSGQVHTPG